MACVKRTSDAPASLLRVSAADFALLADYDYEEDEEEEEALGQFQLSEWHPLHLPGKVPAEAAARSSAPCAARWSWKAMSDRPPARSLPRPLAFPLAVNEASRSIRHASSSQSPGPPAPGESPSSRSRCLRAFPRDVCPLLNWRTKQRLQLLLLFWSSPFSLLVSGVALFSPFPSSRLSCKS